MTPEQSFQSVVEPLLDDPAVAQSKMFGSPAVKVGGKVFAMLVKGKLVVKLPRDRAEALVASGAGEPFDPGHGRIMKEWVAVEVGSADRPALTAEALAFVAGRR